MDEKKSVEGNEVVEAESETAPESAEVPETQSAEPEQEPAEETIPKRRYDELLTRAKKQEADLERAAQYINAYIVKQTNQQPATVEQRLGQLEQRNKELEQRFQYTLLREHEEAKLVAEVEAELEKRPYLRDWAEEIYQAVAYDSGRSVADIAKAFDTRLSKVGKTAVTQVVTTKKAVAGHATAASVPGKPPMPAAKKSAVASAKDWDELEDRLADSARSIRTAREGS